MKNYLILFLLFFNSSFSQQNYFVSLTGSDTTGNGTINSPYRTVEKAAAIAENFILSSPNTSVTINIRGGLYRNSSFSTFNTLSVNDYDPENIGESIWKSDTNNGSVIKLTNIDGNTNAWITIKPYNLESVEIEGDGDIAVSIRNCSYIKIIGLKIKGIAEKLPLELAWKYWGTYRYDNSGTWIYGDRKLDICSTYNLGTCNGLPYNVLTSHFTYSGLPDISNLNVQRPNLFDSKGLLVNLSHHIDILNCEISNFPGGGLRATASDYLNLNYNIVHHNSSRASVGTHGFVIEGLTSDSGTNSNVLKCTLEGNLVYSNYNELYSWVQSKTICTTGIDEGKGIALLRTGTTFNGFNGIIKVINNICYDNGKSGIHANDVDNAEIIHNTVAYNSHTDVYNYDLSGGTNGGISIQNSNSIKIVNNIVVVQSGFSPQLKALSEGQNCNGEIVSDNIVFGSTSNDFTGGFTIVDPKFVSPLTYNFNILSTSPAINSANPTYSVSNDYYGLTRPLNKDKGAIEYLYSNCVLNSTTWNGTSWSNEEPKDFKQAIFTSNYSSSKDLNCCSMIIQNNAKVIINSGHTLTVGANIQVDNGSFLTIDTNAALIQFDEAYSNSGNIIVKRNSAPMRRLDYTAWSSPVTGQQLQLFSPNTLSNRFYEYLYTGTSTPTAYNSVNPLTNFVLGKGYMIRAANTWPTLPTNYNGVFTGVPNNLTISQIIGLGKNLIGNPYASPIQADEFLKNNTNVNALYFWTNTVPASGGIYPQNNFATYSLLGGVASVSGSEIPNGKIQTGQGFFVNAQNAGTITFKNSQRIKATTTSQFFKSSSINENIQTTLARFWLSFYKDDLEINQVMIGYSENSTDEFDFQIDAEILDNANDYFVAKLNDKKLVIEGLKYPINEEKLIPVILNCTTDGKYKIKLDNFENLFINNEIYLYDSQFNTYYNLKENFFELYLKSGIYDSRFYLTYKKSESNDSNELIFNVFYKNKVITIQSEEKINSIYIYDITGKKLYTNENLKNMYLEIPFQKSIGIYIIKIELLNGKIINKKIIVEN